MNELFPVIPHRVWPWLSAAAVAVGGVLLFLTSTSGGNPSKAAEASVESAEVAPTVSTSKVRLSDLTQFLSVSGSLVAREEVFAVALIDSVKVESLLVEIGDTVSAGQVLAVLDDSTLKARLAQNTVELEKAEATIRQSEAAIVEQEAVLSEAREAELRGRKLRATETLSKESFKTRETTLLVANARLTALVESLNLARVSKTYTETQRQEILLNLARTEVKALAGGVVVAKNVTLGQMVSSSSEPLFRIARDGLVELEAEVVSSKIEQLRAMQAVFLNMGPNSVTVGQVRLVSPVIDPASRLGKVRVEFPKAKGLRPGQFVTAKIELRRYEAVVVPATAVLRNGAATLVMVVENGRVASRNVVVGDRVPSGVEIMQGLSIEEQIVTRAGGLLKDGDQVNAVADANATSVESQLPDVRKN